MAIHCSTLGGRVDGRRLVSASGAHGRGVRKKQEGEHLLFGFLTTEANDTVRPIHAKAMPVILRTPEEMDQWMTAPAPEAVALQRPLAADALRIVARGEKQDEPPLMVA